MVNLAPETHILFPRGYLNIATYGDPPNKLLELPSQYILHRTCRRVLVSHYLLPKPSHDGYLQEVFLIWDAPSWHKFRTLLMFTPDGQRSLLREPKARLSHLEALTVNIWGGCSILFPCYRMVLHSALNVAKKSASQAPSVLSLM